MSIPNWYVLILLALASFRTWRLLAEDDILDRPRRYVTRLSPTWQDDGDPTGPDYRVTLGTFIGCPWCLGFWLTLAWWGAWQIWPHGTTVVAVPMALSALVALTERVTSSD